MCRNRPLPSLVHNCTRMHLSRTRDRNQEEGHRCCSWGLPSRPGRHRSSGPCTRHERILIVVVADRLQARVQGSFFILEVRLLPSGLADDVALAVANVPGGVLQVLRLARVVVDVQGGEPVGGGGMASQERDDQGQNHS